MCAQTYSTDGKIAVLLVHKPSPTHREQGETKGRGRPLQISRPQVNKQDNSHVRIVLGRHKKKNISSSAHKNLKFVQTSYWGLLTCSVQTASITHGSQNGFHCGNDGQNISYKDKGEGEGAEPPIAQVQLVSQLTVTSSQ